MKGLTKLTATQEKTLIKFLKLRRKRNEMIIYQSFLESRIELSGTLISSHREKPFLNTDQEKLIKDRLDKARKKIKYSKGSVSWLTKALVNEIIALNLYK